MVEMAGKKAIVVVSFGTSVEATRKRTIEACEAAIRDAFPEYDARRAFTSQTIIAILKQRDNLNVDTPEQALQRLHQEGYTDVIVQPLHIIAGLEFHDVAKTAKQFESHFHSLRIGMPLLATTDDYLSVADVLKTQFSEIGERDAVVLMGHGTAHPANAAYLALERILRTHGMERAFIGTVEGYPERDQVIATLQTLGVTTVTLAPLMLVAGDHAINDMAGDDNDSWKRQLQQAGFRVNIRMQGLGELPAIQSIYIQHIRAAIAGKRGHD
ncbi:precorrin-4 C11-methyltransferase [Candidatus Moduliflexus flocculans]|uniref:Precorrin-4 C11-methyltransferase n=1 Tax=Candidatus Moduliflexus flocculans TaxID=1499966 RepID=A0A0S6VU31_9BACT|nr:precorrin-4 C11-methyltransferase [Candidatus Moduliflexus flocculans]